MNNTDQILNKFAAFKDKVDDTIHSLEQKIASLENAKEIKAQKTAQFQRLLEKAAKALYDADFITDYDEREEFVKRAQANPEFLIKTLIKVSEASDVGGFGKVANVSSVGYDKNDPIAARAFGYNQHTSYSLLED